MDGITVTEYIGCGSDGPGDHLRQLMTEEEKSAYFSGQRNMLAENDADIRRDNTYWNQRAKAGLTYPCD